MFVNSSVALLLVCAIFGAVHCNSVPKSEQDCSQICPALYAPLCATNGKHFKAFNNNCELKFSNCRNKAKHAALETYVETDMDWCITKYVDLEKLVKKLDYLNLQTPECMKPCNLIYSPVCMSNGKYRSEVSNKCVMEVINCDLANKGLDLFKVLQDGIC